MRYAFLQFFGLSFVPLSKFQKQSRAFSPVYENLPAGLLAMSTEPAHSKSDRVRTRVKSLAPKQTDLQDMPPRRMFNL